MHTNMNELRIVLTPVEADMIRRDLESIRIAHPEYFSFASKLSEFYHVVHIYCGKAEQPK